MVATLLGLVTMFFTLAGRMETTAKNNENHEVRITTLEREFTDFRAEYRIDIREVKATQQQLLMTLQHPTLKR